MTTTITQPSTAPQRSLKAAQKRGVAMVEAVILLPVLLLLFFGILYVAKVNDAKLAVLTQARGQAWVASMTSCESTSTSQNQQHPEARGVKNQVDSTLAQTQSSSSEKTSGPIGGVIGSLLNAPLKALFGESVTTQASRTVQRPVYLGGKTTTVIGSYRLPCNIKPQSLWDIVSTLWDKLCPL